MPLPRNIPSFVAKMIRGCWQYNPESRPNFKRISKFLPSNYTPEPQVSYDHLHKNCIIIF